MIPFYLKSGDAKLYYYNYTLASAPPVVYMVFFVLKIATIPSYIVLIILLIKRHRQNLKLYFSNFDKKDLNWVLYLVGSVALVGLIVIVIGISKLGEFTFGFENSEKLIFVVASFWVFGLGFYGLQQAPIFQNVAYGAGENIKDSNGKTENISRNNDNTNNKYKRERLKKFENEYFKTKMEEYLHTEKPYLKLKLTIDELAESLSVTPHDFSLFINESLGLNFFDLINSYRVDEFKIRIMDPRSKKLTLLGNAIDCGFNSKASFNRIFKKHTGLSPSQYLKQKIIS